MRRSEGIESDEAETRSRTMNHHLSQEVDEYIKDTIDYSLGLPISMESLQKKLYTTEETYRRLREQYLTLVSRLKEKDHVIDRVKSESSMNAQALKKFVDENQKLASECGNLLSQCKKLEKECLLYHQDRDALMEFGNESDERAREAEARVRQLEEEIGRISEEIKICKRQIGDGEVDNCTTPLEEDLLDSVLGSLISKDETLMGRLFLEANVHDQSCQNLLSKWDHLKPSTQKVLALISRAKKFETEKECIILNLAKAEQEVELVSTLNRKLDKENRKLLRQHSPLCSADRNRNSASAKSNKRKSPKMMTSPVEKKLEFSSSPELSRKPLSPVWHNNSPDSRMNNN
ncbi:hypothetical protein CARUB_v10001320mg [Capsella rubella]|uniref:Uncharacterized protein n=1 Tax=Capsella rubella TaxID=81985 RepID=R0HBH0_9BRAS|nr:uncharacterized protein LOC17881453 [Capsella rubella]EOA20988.1 hypothetical protein CARUB_v10001320mg [Capsella rubella]